MHTDNIPLPTWFVHLQTLALLEVLLERNMKMCRPTKMSGFPNLKLWYANGFLCMFLFKFLPSPLPHHPSV